MKILSEDLDQLTIFKVQGDVVADASDDLLAEVRERMNRQVRDFVFDLAETEFIDSRGLEALLEIQDNATEQLGQVRLAAVAEGVSEILRITRLASRIERHATVDEAIKSMRI